MRRDVVRVMSGLSVAVVGLALRAGSEPRPATLAAAPVGVVQPTRARARPVPRAATVSPMRVTPAPPQRPSPVAVTRLPTAPRPVAPPRPVTVNGATVDTPYGPVQVQITVAGGRIVRAEAVNYPQDGGRSQEINSQAIPQLNRHATSAQSANIDTVSGATYTSQGYRQSLQSALDAAHAG